MNKVELWKKFCDKNPNFLIDGAEHTFTSKGVKQLFEQTWSVAFNHGLLISKNLDKVTQNNDNMNIFSSLFGGK